MIPDTVFETVRATIDKIDDCERKKGMIDAFVLFEYGWKKTPAFNLYQVIRDLKKEIRKIYADKDEIQRKKNHITDLEARIVKLKGLLTKNGIKC